MKAERKLKVLFVCNLNVMRSPTAEMIFGKVPHLEVKSAGIYEDAVVPLSRELAEWTDLIFVMEKKQGDFIRKKYGNALQSKRVVCLDIPDEYEFMSPPLIRSLVEKVTPYLDDDRIPR